MGKGYLIITILGLACLVDPAPLGQSVPKVSARRTSLPILLDGRLDEPDWQRVEPATGFIQKEPRQGDPATEQTQVRFLYDEENLYIGALCLDSEGEKGIVVIDVRRDYSDNDNDHLAIVLDTFNDDRNGFLFATNPRGAKRDGQISGDGRPNFDWDGNWSVETRITPDGWQAEMAIPFKTLRFRRGTGQVWGMNVVRRIRRKNEDTHWSPVPRPYRISQVLFAGELHGVDALRQGHNLYIKPYLSAPLERQFRDDVDFLPEAGLDVKYGLTPGMTLDLTVNTDFAQVEADEQQINLTRFSLFFPEKREFFLENAGLFQVGPFGATFGPGGQRDLIPFFSRRIGISGGQAVPILGGARLSGRVGSYTLGLLSMQTEDFRGIPSTNFSVIRLRRDVLRNSDIGTFFINKEVEPGNFNRTFGADATFRFFRFLDVSSFVVKTKTPGVSREDLAGFFRVNWSDPKLEARAEYITIEDGFNPEVGFVPRTGIRKSRGGLTLKPRPGERIEWIREFRPSAELEYVTDQEGGLETRIATSGLEVLFQNSSSLEFSLRGRFERLDSPFRIRAGQDIPVGDYAFNQYSLSYNSDQSQKVFGGAGFSSGGFFDGEIDSYQLRFGLHPGFRLAADVTWSHDDVRLGSGDFETDLITSRIRYAFSTELFLNALIQYNSTIREIASNIRLNFLYKPLSDFFLVYNERRSTRGEVLERALIAKITYMFDF